MPMRRELYPDNWEEISKRIRFERAKGKCEKCGAENYKPHPDTGSKVILTVAHLNHEKMDCRNENLLALCQRCHLNLDRHLHALNSRKTRNRKSGQIELIPETLERDYPGNIREAAE